MKAQAILKKAFVDLEKIADKMTEQERNDLSRELEGLSLRAGEIAGYFYMRSGSGCGDQGHRAAVKRLNRNGKNIWVKAFGYNAYSNVSF